MARPSRSLFLNKLHSLLEERTNEENLRWFGDDAFGITSDEFEARKALAPSIEFQLLSSFARQLNYYSFKRLSDGRRASERYSKQAPCIIFSHPDFLRHNSSRLHLIVRKVRNRGRQTPATLQPPINITSRYGYTPTSYYRAMVSEPSSGLFSPVKHSATPPMLFRHYDPSYYSPPASKSRFFGKREKEPLEARVEEYDSRSIPSPHQVYEASPPRNTLSTFDFFEHLSTYPTYQRDTFNCTNDDSWERSYTPGTNFLQAGAVGRQGFEESHLRLYRSPTTPHYQSPSSSVDSDTPSLSYFLSPPTPPGSLHPPPPSLLYFAVAQPPSKRDQFYSQGRTSHQTPIQSQRGWSS